MFPKNDAHPPFVSSFPPLAVISATKGNQCGNKIVSSRKRAFYKRRIFPKMETGISESAETKPFKSTRFVSLRSRHFDD